MNGLEVVQEVFVDLLIVLLSSREKAFGKLS